MAALRGDIERGQRSQEQVLAEVESKHEQEMQTIVTEHAQKVSQPDSCVVIICILHNYISLYM